MAVRRANPDTIMGLTHDEAETFVEADFQIRSGKCPNGCGPLTPTDYGQQCRACSFSTNVMPDREAMQ